jgi:CubicO group peptidase (beta-lactamase class C family)
MFATILAAASGVGAAHEPLTGQVPTHGDARRAVAEIAGAATQRGFAGQVLAVRDGAVLFHEAFGLSDEAAGTATTVETVYAIGSVTKQFTRVSILKLEEDGRLDTSDTISRHLEGLPADKRDITIQQVLDMRAGFHEYHDDTGDHQAMNRDEALRRIYAQELRFEPGTERAYSNSGYSLLAAIVENVSGMTFPEYVRTELLDPLGLDAIGFHGDDRWSDARAARGRGGAREGDNAPHTWPVVTWALQGAGGMVASAEDLSEWIRALRTGRVLGPVALTAAYGDGPAVYAGGDDFGFQTGVVEVDAGDDFVVVNTNNGSDVLEIALDAVEAMTGERVDFGPQRVVDDDEGPAPGGGPGGGIPDSPRARAATAFMEALRAGTNDAFDALVRDSFARELRDEFTMDGHREMLITLKDVVDTADGVGLSPLAEFTVAIMLQPGTRRIILDLEESPPHGIIGIRLEGS